MRTITIQFEFPNAYEHDEIVREINGAIFDMNPTLSEQMTYTILERK